MKRVWGFILTFILILNTVITPGISARAQNVVGAMSGVGMQAADNEIGATSLQDDNEDSVTRPAIMRRADRILGLQQYDEYFIADSDAKIYRDNLNESYPASYLVEEARSRLGYTSLMSVINFANNENFRSHPEYYYEAALMSLLFEQMNDQSFWDSNEQEVDRETINIAKNLLGTAVGAETDALEELQKMDKNAISDADYLNALKGLRGLQNAEAVLYKIFDYATDALEVVQYAESLQKIISLQEEIVDFLEEMKERTNNEHLETALDKIVAIYREQQENPNNAINIVVGLQTGEMAMSRIMQNSLDVLWEGLCVMFPELKVIELAFSIEGFVLEQVFSPDAISDAYAKLAAIWELEKVARSSVYYLGLEYSQSCGEVTEKSEKLAGVFNAGWDFFTILLDADCQASLLFAKVTYNSGLHGFLQSFSGGDDYKQYADQVKLYQNQLSAWKNEICMYMEGLKPENRKVSGAVFPEYEVELDPGETYTLDLEVIPADAKDNYVDYGIVMEDDDTGDEDSYDMVKENNIVRIEGNKLTAISHGTVQIEGIAGDIRSRDVMTVHVTLGGISENGLIFRVDENNEAIITGYTGTASKVEIPSYISNSRTDTIEAMYPVTKVEKFTGQSGKNTTVQEIVLPTSVKKIEDYAFYQCTAMKKINLENVAQIGEYAFGYCSSLEEVTLKQSKTDFTRMEGFAFAYCTSLRKIDLSKILLANIPEGFCYKCTSLKTILWPPNVVRIRYWAFYDCGFEELELPDTIGWLEASAVAECKNLKILVLPNSIVEVDPDPLKFGNADDTVYYVEQYSYIYRRLEQWNNAMGYDFHMEYIKYLTTPKPSYTISVGETLTIPYRKNPVLTGEVITFSSSDPSVAYITSNGVLTGKRPGTVTLSLKSSYGQTFSGCKVTVTAGSGSGTQGNSGNGASSGTGGNGQQAVRTAKTIKKTKKTKNIATGTVGKTLKLKVKMMPSNANEKITWTSSKPKVATVSQDGKVIPKKKGKTKITARIANGKKVTWKIKVKELKAKKISLKKKVTLYEGETLKLKAKLKPKGSTAKIKWKSSKKKVASVSKNGTITARKKGKAVITAQLPNGKKAKCKVTVKKAVPQSSDSAGGNKNNNSGNTGGYNGQNNTGGNSNSSNTPGTQPGGETGNSGGGSGTSGDSQFPGDSGGQNPDEGQNPGGDGSEDENVPTKLTLATDNLTLKGRWQTITLSAEEETEIHVGDEVEITAEPDSFYGDSQILDAEITEGNDMQRIHWSSADETIVKVYNGGLVRGVRTGTTTVTATTTDGTTAECQVTVEGADLQWISSDTEVAEISSVDSDDRTAHITAGKEGTADITVYSGSYQSTCRLTVSADSTDPEEPTDPTDSTEPTEPTDPTDSTEPTEPTDPTDSTEPTEPTDPDDSEDPDNPDAQPISTKEDLKAIVNDLDGDYVLTNDIDISGENWTPIGTIEKPFKGTLDGDGHTISGLTIEEELYMENEEYYIGLFGVLQGGSHTNAVTISDLTLEGTIVLRGGQGIDNEELEMWLQAGTLAAEVNWAIFDNCTNRVNITADFSMTQDTDDMNLYVGGMVGGCNDNSHMYFKQCTNEGKITVKVNGGEEVMAYTGGLIGRGVADIAIQECTNKGNITVSTKTSDVEGGQTVVTYTGGMAGDLIIADLVDCINHADIHCYAEIKEKPEFSPSGEYCLAGGMAGKERAGITKENLQNTGNISAESPNEEMTVLYGDLFGYPAE